MGVRAEPGRCPPSSLSRVPGPRERGASQEAGARPGLWAQEMRSLLVTPRMPPAGRAPDGPAALQAQTLGTETAAQNAAERASFLT